MPQIKAHDEIQLNCLVDDVWNILIDIPNYHKWWPNSVNLKVSNFTDDIIYTQFEARPLGGKSFSCRVVSIVPKKEIKLNYFEGIYRGEGIWNIEGKENLISVSYRVDLEIVDKSIALLSRVIPIPKLHSMIFKRILAGLAEQIKSNLLKQ
ncbi:MAG: SRPBCC family protein [Ignavibacteriaceae bacterium]|nr:SRPBCC family protein [Ignavibacteriaceae bacterium]